MRKLKRASFIVLAILAVLAIGGWIFMSTAPFGAAPEGSRLERIQKSPNYRDSSFQNVEETPVQLPGTNWVKLMWKFFNPSKLNRPPAPIPSVVTNLKAIDNATPTIVWFGHSSYLIKSKQGTILVDPVFSGHASPISFFGKAFDGTNLYGVKDFPHIDVLVITHDHYDHLDYETIKQIAPNVGRFVTALGVGAHLERWGVPAEKITELDWWENTYAGDGIQFTSTPARHFSGRGIKRGGSLWSSFVLELGSYKIFIGGDSGYDPTFKKIGDKFGPFDIAMLECGQYGDAWPYIHMTPEQTAQAAIDLKTKVLLPVHWAKFSLALHDWDDSIRRLVAEAGKKNLKLTTPLIGQPIVLDDFYPDKPWWEQVK